MVAQRPGSPQEQGLAPELSAQIAGREAADAAALRAAPAGRVLRLNQPLHAESASQVRQRIAAGQPWQDLVPAPVAVYIERHGLYADQASPVAPL